MRHRLFEHTVPIASGALGNEASFATSAGPSAATASSYVAGTSAAAAAASVVAPAHAPGATVHVRGIRLDNGWSVRTYRGAIADSATIDAVSASLGVPVPEMPFVHNRLVLLHHPSGWRYEFDAVRALRSVEGVEERVAIAGRDLSDATGDAQPSAAASRRRATASTFGEKPKTKRRGIKVAYADEWGKKREQGLTEGNFGGGPSGSQAHVSPTDKQAPTTTAGDAGGGGEGSAASFFGPNAANNAIASARDYDWTYSTTWPGCEGVAESAARAADDDGSLPPTPVDELLSVPAASAHASVHAAAAVTATSRFEPARDATTDRIPVERLGASSGEPILFYDDVVLFEDELGDNGSALLSVKVRVMPSGFLVLQRFFLRVDDVVFRLFDTRLYAEFAGPPKAPAPGGPGGRAAGEAAATMDTLSAALGRATTSAARGWARGSAKGGGTRLVRELSGCEAAYADVRARLPAWKPNDLSPLTDVNWVAQTLQSLSAAKTRHMVASGNYSGVGAGGLVGGAGATARGSTAALAPSSAWPPPPPPPPPHTTEYRPVGTLPLSACAPAVVPLGGGGVVGGATAPANRILGEVGGPGGGGGGGGGGGLAGALAGSTALEGAAWQGHGSVTEVAFVGGGKDDDDNE